MNDWTCAILVHTAEATDSCQLHHFQLVPTRSILYRIQHDPTYSQHNRASVFPGKMFFDSAMDRSRSFQTCSDSYRLRMTTYNIQNLFRQTKLRAADFRDGEHTDSSTRLSWIFLRHLLSAIRNIIFNIQRVLCFDKPTSLS